MIGRRDEIQFGIGLVIIKLDSLELVGLDKENRRKHLQALAQGARVAGNPLLIRRNMYWGRSSELF